MHTKKHPIKRDAFFCLLSKVFIKFKVLKKYIVINKLKLTQTNFKKSNIF